MEQEQQNQTDIFAEMGLQNLSEADKQDFLSDFMQALQYKMILRLDSILTKEQKDDFDKFSKENSENDGAVLEYLYDKVPNYNEVLNEEAMSLRNEMIEDAKNISKI